MARTGLLRSLSDPAPPLPWLRWPALYLAALLFVLDALVMGTGLLAAALWVLAVGWLIPKALLLFAVRRDGRSPARLAALLVLTAVAIMLTIGANNGLARRRAADLISAVELYRAASGHYPESLAVLVPAYLDEVPNAKYALAYKQFVYFKHQGRAALGFIEVPPYGRPFYDFERRRWDYLN